MAQLNASPRHAPAVHINGLNNTNNSLINNLITTIIIRGPDTIYSRVLYSSALTASQHNGDNHVLTQSRDATDTSVEARARSTSDQARDQAREKSPAELKLDDFEVLGEAKNGTPIQSTTNTGQSRDSTDKPRDSSDQSINGLNEISFNSRRASDSESKNRAVPSEPKVKSYFKTPEGVWHMLDLDTGRRVDQTKKEIVPDKPEPKNSSLAMPRTSHALTSSVTDRAINRTPPNSLHVSSHDALHFVHETDASKVTWVYSVSTPPANQSATQASKGALKIVKTVLSREIDREIDRDSCERESFTLQFRHPPSCHVLNRATARHELAENKPKIELELLIGFKSGDILLHDPIRKSFTKHFNKGKALSRGAVAKLSWHPTNPDLFIASFDDTVTYNQNNSNDIRPPSLGGNLFVIDRKRIEDDSVQLPMIADMQRFSLWRHQNANVNPVSRWHVSSKPVKDFAFSSTGQYLATASLDGFLRVFDFNAELMIVVFKSYYGGLSCVSWTPDDKYLVLGGEDDALYICAFDALDPARCCFVARGRAHHSWLSKITCDPWHGKGDGHYRIVSVAQDCRLVLWDFALDTLLLPKQARARRNSLRRSSIHLPRPIGLEDAAPTINQGCAPVITCPEEGLAALAPLAVYHSAHTAPYADVQVTPQLLSVAAWGGLLTCFIRPTNVK